MYTGRISEIGRTVRASRNELVVEARGAAARIAAGSCLGVAGVNLCVDEVQGDTVTATLSPETRRRTTLRDLGDGSPVNVELPLRAGDPLEGHLVQGHVDAVGVVDAVTEEGATRRVSIRLPAELRGGLEPRGSIAVDGVSLTIADVTADGFTVVLVPATLRATTLELLAPGQAVNLELDLVGKLVRRHGGHPARAVERAVATLPWAGRQSGPGAVDKAVAQIAGGGLVIVWDPEREGEGDLIAAGAELGPDVVTFILTRACGHMTVPCERHILDRLEIPPMPGPGDHHGTAMHVSVDLAAAPGTGVSAAERAACVRRLADPQARPDDFVAPGHVFPLAARPGGPRERAGHTEITVALALAAGLTGAGVCCEIMQPDGQMAGAAELERLALEWGLPMFDMQELVAGL